MTKEQVFDFHLSLYELMEWARGECERMAPHVGHDDIEAQDSYAKHDIIYRKASTLWGELEPIVEDIKKDFEGNHTIIDPDLTGLQKKAIEGMRENPNRIKSFDEWKKQRESEGRVFAHDKIALDVYREYKHVMIMRTMQQSRSSTPYTHAMGKGYYEQPIVLMPETTKDDLRKAMLDAFKEDE